MSKTLTALLLCATALSAQYTAVYPGRPATDADLFVTTDGALAGLAADVSAIATTVTVATGRGVLFPVNTLIQIDSEKMLVTGVAGDVLTVTRAFAGTSAATHAAGACTTAGTGRCVKGYIFSDHHERLKKEVIAVQGALGTNLGNVLKVPASGAGVLVKGGTNVPTVVTGSASDCVRVDGTSGACGGAGGGAAADITSVPAGGLASSNVQDALNELDTEKFTKPAGTSGQCVRGDGSIGSCSGTGGDAISNEVTNADGQVALYAADADGKHLKASTLTGVLKSTTGVAAVVTGGASDFVKVDGSSAAGVLPTRQIICATGLTGCGDLSANRTLALDINALTEKVTPVAGTDWVPIWDVAGGASKKAKWPSTGGAGSISQLLDFLASGDGTAELTIGSNCSPTALCNVRIGAKNYAFDNAIAATETGTGTAWFYIDPADGVRKAVHSLTTMTSTGAGTLTVVGAGTGFPAESIPLYACTATAGTWDASGCTDGRALISYPKRLVASTNITLVEDEDSVTISSTGGGASYDLSDMTAKAYVIDWGSPTTGSPASMPYKFSTQCGSGTPAVGRAGYLSGLAIFLQVSGATGTCSAVAPGLAAIKDFASGGTPLVWTFKHIGGRRDNIAGGFYYGPAMSTSATSWDNSYGCRYSVAAGAWQSYIRASGVDVDADNIAGSTATDTVYSMTTDNNNGTAGTVRCTVAGVTATSTGTIPVGDIYWGWGQQNTTSATNNTYGFAAESRLVISGRTF